jgi:putative endonuclease
LGDALNPFPVILRRPPKAGLEGCGPDVAAKGYMGAFVYMLRCSNRSLYVGISTGDDLTLRIAQHNAGAYRGYTFTRRPVQLIWSEHFPVITDAIAVERQLKGWRRKKKEALASGEWSRVQSLAKRRAGRPLETR